MNNVQGNEGIAVNKYNTSVPYSDELINKKHLLDHLVQKGYKIVSQADGEAARGMQHVIAISKFATKETIGLRRHPASGTAPSCRASLGAHFELQTRNWFADAFIATISLGRYMAGSKAVTAIAMPDTVRSRRIVEKLQAYFTENGLDMKVYLVGEDGIVTEQYLNTLRKPARVASVQACDE